MVHRLYVKDATWQMAHDADDWIRKSLSNGALSCSRYLDLEASVVDNALSARDAATRKVKS